MTKPIDSLIELSEVWNTDGDVDKCEVDLHKFAILIVRECASIYERIDNGNMHMGTEDYLEALRKHFGV